MISMSRIKNPGGAAKYMTEQHAVEYYADERIQSEWGGRGSVIQGLQGDVSAQDLTDQLQGRVKEVDQSGKLVSTQLGVVRNGELQHRAGWDLTFSAPKSVSIESEVWGRNDVRLANENAVKAAMKFLEDKAAQTRVNGEMVRTGNLTYSMFQHATSRSGDPQTHTHVLLANVTYLNGKAYSLSNEQILQFRTAADAVYKNELAHQLIHQGYELKWDSKGNFEVVGYSKEQLNVFSKRNDEIKNELAKHGLDKHSAGGLSRQMATLATRKDKEHSESAAEHRDRWQQEARGAGIEPAARDMAQMSATGGQKEAADAVQSAINHLTEREMAFGEKDLWKSACEFSQGRVSIDRIQEAIRVQIDRGNLVQRDDGKFTTQSAVEAEIDMAKHLASGAGAHESVMTDIEFEKSLAKFEHQKGFELSPEQRNAARALLTGDDRFHGVQGLAGTGKTTLLEFIRIAAESKGWQVQGFSNGGAQADKLQAESGIQSTTTSRFLADFRVTARDANLAAMALQTYERHSGVFGESPNWKALEQGVRQGTVRLEFDSQKRAYYTDPRGNTWTHGLTDKVREVYSKNINHLGLTETKYVITPQGVFKSGGDPVSEVAGALREKLEGRSYVADKVLGHFEKWEKCSVVEAGAVRARAAVESQIKLRAELKELRSMADRANGQQHRTLLVMDEASLSGQREFNRVIQATERTGAKAVFLGDDKQHQSVEAGKAFELAQKFMKMSYLGADSIIRQTTEKAKNAVAGILLGKHIDAMRGLETKETRINQDAVLDKYRNMEKLSERDKENFKTEMKAAAEKDNLRVIGRLAKDYASMSQQDRGRTLIVTSTNQDRNLINAAVRGELKQQGLLQDGHQMTTLQKSDRTAEELKLASSYEKGQIVSFTSDYKSLGIQKGFEGQVISSDSRLNSVSVKMEDGRVVTFNPEKLAGKELYNEQRGKEFAAGDRVTFTKNDDKELNVRNGQTGTVEKFEGHQMTIRMDNGEIKELDTRDYKHLDHAYASTSHKSQGQTVVQVFKHHNTELGRHGDRETYVDLTRAKEEVTVYTQDAEKAAIQSGQRMDKEQATDKELAISAKSEQAIDKKAEREEGKESAAGTKSQEKIAESGRDMPESLLEAIKGKFAGKQSDTGETKKEKASAREQERDFDYGR